MRYAGETRFSKVSSRFWLDEKTMVWSKEARYLALYFLTTHHKNLLGCYVIPITYIAEDTGLAHDDLQKGIATLKDDDFIRYDERTSLVLLPKYLLHNPINTAKQAKIAIRLVSELPDSKLLADLANIISFFNKEHLEELERAVRSRLSKDRLAKNTRKPMPSYDDEYTDDFATFWDVYPRKINKLRAFRVWNARIKEGVPASDMISAAGHYAKLCKIRGTNKQYIQHATTFLGPSKPFLDFIEGIPKDELQSAQKAKLSRNVRKGLELLEELGGDDEF